MNSKRLVFSLLLGVAFLVAVFGPRYWNGEQKAAGPPPVATPAAARVYRVTTHTVRPERLAERLATSGTVFPSEHVELVSEMAGKVRKVLFSEGGWVDKGQALLEIDDTELLAQQKRTTYRIELAQLREGRQKTLLDQGVISQQDYDTTVTELNVLRADFAVLEAQLKKAVVRAPFAGIVGLRQVSEGSYLSPQTVIATLQQLDPVKLDFTVPERYAAKVRVGDQVTFRVKGTDSDFGARITAIEPAMDAETRSLTVRAQAANPGRRLVPGAFADVDLVIREIDQAFTVPSIAIIPELGGAKVFVIEGGVAQPRPVETGLRTEDRVQIVSGLVSGDQVITSAIQDLKPGLLVEAVGEGSGTGAP
ncbi:MAG: efflux RND transporter periplasmic adaptor subunit [Thermoanaerobaculia bacterium]|nr:efflux RND transporter periplasmic adaptor subunit [Thermoanaerobaculia bacterium]